jgi:adenine-specific DNA-methyltransferase
MHPKRSERSGRLDVEHRVYLDSSISIEEPEEDDDDDDDGAVERTSKPKSVWIGAEFSTDSAKRALKEFMPGEVFDFPKSIDFLRTCILLGTSGTDIVLDLFAGSGSMAQAVMLQNAIDGQSRRFACVQLPEPLSPSEKSQKAGAALCDKLGVQRNIAELTKERIRRAGTKIKDDNPLFASDVGFRVFKLDTSNIRAWNPNPADLEQSLFDHQDHLADGRTETDVLYELMLKRGLDLCVPMVSRNLHGKEVHAVGGGVLLACLATNITTKEVEALGQAIAAWHKELAPVGDSTCVFRDSAFEDDVAKTNLTSILEQNGIPNVRSL